MRRTLSLFAILCVSISMAQVKSVEPIAPGLPFTGPDAPATDGMLSADGSVFAFKSYASNLTSGLKPSFYSLYVQTLSDRKIHRVPTTSDFVLGRFRLSADGRRLAFSDLTSVFLYDRTTNLIRTVGILPDGKNVKGEVVGMNRDGSKLLLRLNNGKWFDYSYYLRDVATGIVSRIQTNSAGEGIKNFLEAQLTQDGKAVFFRSNDPRLPKGRGEYSTYRKSLNTGEVMLVEDSGDALLETDFAGDKMLLFRDPSLASGQRAGYSIFDLKTKKKQWLPVTLSRLKLSGDGALVFGTFPREPYLAGPIMAYRIADGTWKKVRDRNTQNHEVRSLSGDGSRIVYAESRQSPSPTVSVCDLDGVEVPNVDANLPGAVNDHLTSISISANGSRIAMATSATNLVARVVPGTPQVYVRNVPERTTTLESIGADGEPVRGTVEMVNISSNGRYLAYSVKRSYFATDFSLIVRDLQTRKNIGSKSYPGRAQHIRVANDGRVVIVSDYVANVARQFDPFTGLEVDLKSQIPAGSTLGNSFYGIWSTADGNEVFLPITDTTNNTRSILRVSMNGLTVDALPLARNDEVVNISEDGKYALLLSVTTIGVSQITRIERKLNLRTRQITSLPIPIPWGNLAISRNGRYANKGDLVFDIDNAAGWRLDNQEANSVGITNGADPIVYASMNLGGLPISHLNQPYMVRVGLPDHSPDTFIYTSTTLVKSEINLNLRGQSFKELPENLKFQVRIGSGPWSTPGPAQQTVTLPNDGVHQISVRSVDSAGRVDPTPATLWVTSDTSAPEVSGAARISKTTAKISGSASEAVRWRVRIRLAGTGETVHEQVDDAPFTSFETIVSGLVPNTSYEYDLIATDRVGLATTFTGTFVTGV